MIQFQLCILALFVLLVSNCVAEYAMSTTEVYSHYDTAQSAINNKHKGAPHSYALQQHSLGTQARTMSGRENKISPQPQRESEERQLQEMPQTPKVDSGEADGNKGTNRKTENIPNGSSDPNTLNGGAGAKGTQQGSTDSNTDGKQGSSTDAKGGQEEESKTNTDPNPKKGDSPPAPDALASESTTTVEPASEGDHTAGSSDPTSTTTHSPTGTVQGADSQEAVKAGALSFILSIGIVLAIIV